MIASQHFRREFGMFLDQEIIVELKSVKLYFSQFRDIGITHEELLNTIFEDFNSKISPKYMRMELYVNIRGGIEVTVTREEGNKLIKEN